MRKNINRKLVNILISWALLLCGQVSYAATPRPTPEASTSPSTISSPYFFKATKELKTIYILGTYHQGVLLKHFPAEVKQAINQSEAFLLEITKWNVFNQVCPLQPKISNLGRVFLKGRLHDVKSFAQKIISFAELKEKCSHVDLNNILRDPNIVYFFLNDSFTKQLIYNQFMTQAAQFSLDAEILSLAEARNATTYQLLDKSDIMLKSSWYDFSDFLPHPNQESIDRHVKAVRTRESYEAYMHSDDEFMLAEATDNETIAFQEHQKWLENLNIALTKHDILFLAGGASHFFGESSFLAILEKQGFNVERIQPADKVKE